MWNFQRIICIWICCVSCMFGTTQLSSLVAAVPYEYFDDHDQSFYDLDTEQIQAKYDTRLLSQQMLKTQTQEQQQQQQQHTHGNIKGSRTGGAVGLMAEDDERVHGTSFVSDNSQPNGGDASSSDILTKLKSNDASKNSNNNNSSSSSSSNNNKDNGWLDETTPAITEKLEIHLPRAASCYTNGQKYTHGQKVPRHDSCEVCLCMDGEIFCWWEKCDKKTPKAQTMRYGDYSTPYEESSTMRIQPNDMKSTVRTTLKPMKKPKINKDYKYGRDDVDVDENGGDNVDNDDDAADENNEYDDDGVQQRHNKRPYKGHNKQMAKKKSQEDLELKEKQMKVKKEKLKKQQQQQQQQQQHKTNNDHHYHHPEHQHAASGGSSKILNFPENLPSVLYYDYKTEEHQHHQHQHREQHLKHQHEKELKHRQHIVSRHHEYGDDIGQEFNTDPNAAVTASVSASAAAVATSLMRSAGGGRGRGHGPASPDNDVVLHRQQQPPSSAKYLGNGNDNIYNVDLQTDSDILPEPPTKKPKLPSIATAAASASAAGTPTTTLSYRLSTLSAMSAAGAGATTTITTRPLKKEMFSPWDYGKPNRDKVNNSIKQQQQHNEDVVAADEDQDDAFHRWLTSTEKNNKNSARPEVGDAAGFGGGPNDFEGDDRNNYENIDIDIDAMSLQPTAKTPSEATSSAVAGVGGPHKQLETNGNLKYEINFSDNLNPASPDNINTNTNANANNNDNISPFSNPYQNYKNTNGPTLITAGGKSHSSNDGPLSSGSSSSTSNEDNGVGSVVNIDIMLTASADMAQQTDAKDQPHQLSSEHDKQIPGQPNAKQKSLLISNTNEKDNEPLSSFSSSSSSNSTSSGGDPQLTLGGNLLSSSFTNDSGSSDNSASNSNNNNSFSDSYKLNQSLVSNPTATSSVASASSAQTTPPTSTTLSPERQCNVMGTLYKIGDVLPQDTGNCLQCICIDGSTMDDTPRVTCSPHNCPPLVLPDLFDATGY